MVDARPYDSAGLGLYYNAISDDLKSSVEKLSFGTREAKDEWGTEVFYGLALTPAVRLIASYQYIRNPLAAQVAEQRNKAEVVGVRLTVAW